MRKRQALLILGRAIKLIDEDYFLQGESGRVLSALVNAVCA